MEAGGYRIAEMYMNGFYLLSVFSGTEQPQTMSTHTHGHTHGHTHIHTYIYRRFKDIVFRCV